MTVAALSADARGPDDVSLVARGGQRLVPAEARDQRRRSRVCPPRRTPSSSTSVAGPCGRSSIRLSPRCSSARTTAPGRRARPGATIALRRRADRPLAARVLDGGVAQPQVVAAFGLRRADPRPARRGRRGRRRRARASARGRTRSSRRYLGPDGAGSCLVEGTAGRRRGGRSRGRRRWTPRE